MKKLLFILLLPFVASAQMKMKVTPPTDQIDVNVKSISELTNSSQASASSSSVSDSDASSDSFSESAASNGDQVSMNSSQFYALSLQFPQASGCFSGAQAGGNDNNDSAFLGIHLLNKSCWLNKLASHEQDIELNARLLCGDRKYRNAIAYDVPRGERQKTCIEMKVNSGKSQMEQYQEMIDTAVMQSEARGGLKLDDEIKKVEGSIVDAEERMKERDRRIHEAGQTK